MAGQARRRRLWRGQARTSIHTLTRFPAFAWLRRAKSTTLSTPEEHLIRPSATFFPSNAEKGNLMGEGYEGESSAASLKNLRRDGPDGQPHLKLICSSFAVLFLRIAHFWQNFYHGWTRIDPDGAKTSDPCPSVFIRG
jgi:hypothetical protein